MAGIGKIIAVLCLVFAVVSATESVCPQQGQIVITQNDTSVHDITSLTCSFTLPSRQLYYYQWFLLSTLEVIFYHVVGSNKSVIVQEHESLVLNETHLLSGDSGNSTIVLANASIPHNVYKCKVVTQEHSYCEMDTTAIPKVCPHLDSIRLAQDGKIVRPRGKTTFICVFRVPLGQLAYYQWTVKYNETTLYKYPSLDQRERHSLYDGGGRSSLEVYIELDRDIALVCEIVLRDDQMCSAWVSVEFERPAIAINITQRKSGSTVKATCSIDHSVGKPNITINVPSNRIIFDYGIEVTSAGKQHYSRSYDIEIVRPEMIKCDISDEIGTYIQSRFMMHSVCPDEGSVMIVQHHLVPRPRGLITLACYFQVPPSSLFEYEWARINADGQNERIFFHGIIRSSSNSERVNHTLYNDGGESEILVDVDINTRNTFECRVMLLDEQVCSKRFSVVFEDPLVDVRIYGGTAQHQLGLRFYGHQTHVCSVQKSAGTPHIQFAGRDYGRYPLQSLYTSAVGRETEQYSNGGLFGITSANHTNITCTVTDALGIYVSETIPSPTYCPFEGNVIRSDVDKHGRLELQCRLRAPANDLLQLTWKYASHLGTIEEYNPSSKKNTTGHASTNAFKHDIVSFLTIDTRETNDYGVICLVEFTRGRSCLYLKEINMNKKKHSKSNIFMTIHDQRAHLGTLKQTVDCVVSDAVGTKNVSIQASPDMKAVVKNHRIEQYYGDILRITYRADLTAHNSGRVMCRVHDRRGYHTVHRILSACLSANLLEISQDVPAKRPKGHVILTCHVNASVTTVDHLTWFTYENIKILEYATQTDISEIGFLRESIGTPPKHVVNWTQSFDANGIESKLQVLADIRRNDVFKCAVVLKDKTECVKRIVPLFDDPDISLNVFGKLPGNAQKPDFSNHQTSICSVTYSAGSPKIRFSGRVGFHQPLVVNRSAIAFDDYYYNASLYVDTEYFRRGNLVCLVADRIGSYNKSIVIPYTACPVSAMAIRQTRLVSQLLDLQCHITGVYQNTSLFWKFGSNQRLIYEGNLYGGIEYVGHVSNYIVNGSLISHLKMNIVEFPGKMVTCSVLFGSGQSCASRHMLYVPPSEYTKSDNYEIGAISASSFASILLVLVLLLLVVCLIRSRRKKTREEWRESYSWDKIDGYERIKEVSRSQHLQYRDPVFRSDVKSLFGAYPRELPGRRYINLNKVEWKRPWEICKEPLLCSENGLLPEDVIQGCLWNGWVLSSIGAVAGSGNGSRIRIVDMPGVDLSKKGPGAVCVRLWRLGEWKDIIIDDRLPTIENKLIFGSSDNGVFWVALVEKAFAKVYQSYKSLEHIGPDIDVMSELTGGIVLQLPTVLQDNSDVFEDKNDHEALLDHIQLGYKSGNSMTCFTEKCLYKDDDSLPISVNGSHYFMITKIDDTNTIHLRSPFNETCMCLERFQFRNHESIIRCTSFLDGIQSVQICFNSNRADQDQIKEVKGKIDTENKLFGVLRQQDDRITRKGILPYLPQYKITCETGPTTLIFGVLQLHDPPPRDNPQDIWYLPIKIYLYKIYENQSVTSSMSHVELESRGMLIEKFAQHSTHREHVGYITLHPGNTYVMVIRGLGVLQEIEFLLRTYASNPYRLIALEQKLPDGCQTLRRKSCGALQTKKTKQPTCAMRSVSEGSAHSSFAATSPTLDVRFEWSV